MSILKSRWLTLLLLFAGIVLAVVGVRLMIGNPDVQVMGDEDIYAAIAALAGAATSIVGAVSGFMVRRLDYKTAVLDHETKRMEFEAKKGKKNVG